MTAPTGTDERAPCPFCGSTAIFVEPDERGSGGQWVSPVHVGCRSCQCEQIGDTPAEAIAKWNRRASMGAAQVPSLTKTDIARIHRKVTGGNRFDEYEYLVYRAIADAARDAALSQPSQQGTKS